MIHIIQLDNDQKHLPHGNHWLGEAIGINCQGHTQLVVIWTETETKRPTRYVYNDHKSEDEDSGTSGHTGNEYSGREDEGVNSTTATMAQRM